MSELHGNDSFAAQLAGIMHDYLTPDGVTPNHPYPEQIEVNKRLAEGNNVLYVNRTGAGKSESYFLAAKMLRGNNAKERKIGPVIVFCPFNTLLLDQLERAKKTKLKVGAFLSTFKKLQTEMEQSAVRGKLERNELDILYITMDMVAWANDHPTHTLHNRVPQIGNRTYNGYVDPSGGIPAWNKIPLVVIDEFHYVAESTYKFATIYKTIWDDFKDAYWFKNAQKLGLTATFNNRIERGVSAHVHGFSHWQRIEGDIYRDNIYIRVEQNIGTQEARKKWVADFVSTDGVGRNIVVFVAEIQHCKLYFDAIKKANPNVAVAVHHSSLPADIKKNVEDSFRNGIIKVVIATKGLGHGFDKSDIDDIVHTYTPASMVQYYQEIGRGGRKQGSIARAFLLTKTPWISDGWVNAVVAMTDYLQRSFNQTAALEELDSMLVSKQVFKSRDIEEALESIVKSKIARKEEGGGAVIKLNPDWKMLLTIIEKDQEDRENEKIAMKDLNKVQPCYWKYILTQFEKVLPNGRLCCGICSGTSCAGLVDVSLSQIQTQVSVAAGDKVFYKVATPEGLIVYGLGGPNDSPDSINVDPERIQRLLDHVLPGVSVSPPTYGMAYVPDTEGRNKENITFCCEELLLVPCHFASISADHDRTKSSRAIKPVEMKQDNADNKFEFDISTRAIPGHIDNIVLYDDFMDTGTTLDTVASPLLHVKKQVVCLVKQIGNKKGRVPEQLVFP